jgi:hypothetical protein
MPLPDDDMVRIRRWFDALNAKMPEEARRRLWYEMDVYRNAVTFVECNRMDPEDQGSEFRVPFARLRFTRSRGWELYWSDRNSEFHVYELEEPTQRVAKLLKAIDDDPTGIFFG